jgi:hypothetical protein
MVGDANAGPGTELMSSDPLPSEELKIAKSALRLPMIRL